MESVASIDGHGLLDLHCRVRIVLIRVQTGYRYKMDVG
jgi:hypothetical protein